MVQHVADQRPLPGVRGQNGDFRSGISQQPHILIDGYRVLCLAEVLDEVRAWLYLAFALVVGDVDELVVVAEACVGAEVLGVCCYVGQVAELLVSPAIELGDAGPSATLCVEVDDRNAETDEAQEQALLEVRILSKGEVLHDGGVLIVVAAEDDAL